MRAVVAGWLGVLCAQRADAQSLERFDFERGAMGTRFRVVLYAPDSTHAVNAASAAFDRIEQLDASLSDYDPTSELSRLLLVNY